MTRRDRETVGWCATILMAAGAALVALLYLYLLALAVRHGVVR